jgi:hypothetical protein
VTRSPGRDRLDTLPDAEPLEELGAAGHPGQSTGLARRSRPWTRFEDRRPHLKTGERERKREAHRAPTDDQDLGISSHARFYHTFQSID